MPQSALVSPRKSPEKRLCAALMTFFMYHVSCITASCGQEVVLMYYCKIDGKELSAELTESYGHACPSEDISLASSVWWLLKCRTLIVDRQLYERSNIPPHHVFSCQHRAESTRGNTCAEELLRAT